MHTEVFQDVSGVRFRIAKYRQLLLIVARSCSVGYAQTIPEVFTPGITLQRTSVSFVGHPYPYPELLEVLYDIHTRTRNFWKFCTPVPQIPGVRVYHFYNLCEFCTPVLQHPELM